MNYRHSYHAGNFADAMKHVFLVAVVRAMQVKPKGMVMVDTHAGRGEYELKEAALGQTLPRAPEHPDGIGRLWPGGRASAGAARTEAFADDEEGRLIGNPPAGVPSAAAGAIEDYLTLVRAFSPDLTRYPGSPRLLQMLARPVDRLVLCERHPEEYEHLDIAMGSARHASVHEADGYAHLRAVLPPPERRGLILIDPPYEAPDEWSRVLAALEEGLGRFAAGTFLVWHPVTARAGADRFWEDLARSSGPPVWAGRLLARPADTGFRGSGLIVVNPPYGFAGHADALLLELAKSLCPNGTAGAASRWLRPDA